MLNLRYSFIQQIFIQLLLSGTVIEHEDTPVKNINDTSMPSEKVHGLSQYGCLLDSCIKKSRPLRNIENRFRLEIIN